jgi:hypothetical protein
MREESCEKPTEGRAASDEFDAYELIDQIAITSDKINRDDRAEAVAAKDKPGGAIKTIDRGTDIGMHMIAVLAASAVTCYVGQLLANGCEPLPYPSGERLSRGDHYMRHSYSEEHDDYAE